MGAAIFAKFSVFAEFEGLSLLFGLQIGRGSNFGGSRGQSGQKWPCGLEVGHFEQVPDIFYRSDF